MTKGREAFQKHMAIESKVSFKDGFIVFHLYQPRFNVQRTHFILAS